MGHSSESPGKISRARQGSTKILSNTTSPFARVARIALIEKGMSAEGLRMMNPWGADAEMARLNPASRVPTLELPSGLPLTESLLILLWLEKTRPEPSLLGSGANLDAVISRAGLAMGVIEAMANLVTGRMQIDPGFEGGKVGLKRVGTVVEGFRRLEADPPPHAGGVPDIAVLTAVVAVDYLALRFPDDPWVEPIPKLQALRDAVSVRPAYADTAPYIRAGRRAGVSTPLCGQRPFSPRGEKGGTAQPRRSVSGSPPSFPCAHDTAITWTRHERSRRRQAAVPR